MNDDFDLIGRGYNRLLSDSYMIDSTFPPPFNPEHNEESTQGTEELAINCQPNEFEVELCNAGKIEYGLLHEIAKVKARKNICKEVEGRGRDDV